MVSRKTQAPERKRADYFDDTDVTVNMTGNIVRGSGFVFGSSIVKFLISIGATAILARLLDPEDYGLLAMVFVITNFLNLFRDMNLSLATVQREKITHSQVSTIYWINVAISCAIALAVLALAPGIAWFYSDPRLTAISAVMTLAILLRGFAAQHQALLRRKMRFGAVTYTDVLSMVCGYLAAIMLAWREYGYWSLVWLHVSTAAAFLILSWIATGWRPGRPVRGSGIRTMVSFGANLTGYSIVRYTSRSLDNALIGWYWGAAALGFYSKSRDLLGPVANYLTSPIGAVAIPSLSRLTGDDKRYRTMFRRLFEKIVLITLPASVFLICTSDLVVEIVLGPKWTQAGPILSILAIFIFTESIAGCMNWLFISQGRGRQLFRFGMLEALVRISAVVIGLYWGILGTAVALALSALFVRLPMHIWFGGRSGPVRQLDIYRVFLPVLIASLIGFAAIELLRDTVPVESSVVVLGVSFVTMAAIQLIAMLITRSGRQALRDVQRGAVMMMMMMRPR